MERIGNEAEAQVIADRVCEHFHLPKVVVGVVNRRDDTDEGDYDKKALKIRVPYPVQPKVLGHELAHHLCDNLFPEVKEDHPDKFWFCFGRVQEFLGRPLWEK